MVLIWWVKELQKKGAQPCGEVSSVCMCTGQNDKIESHVVSEPASDKNTSPCSIGCMQSIKHFTIKPVPQSYFSGIHG